jgi:2-polyprenyl-3-methyl-5-hydroxy-6-metoxy-1,4-benzoquinol methylase
VELARLGHRVTGLDLSEPLLAAARRLAVDRGAQVEWNGRDMHDLSRLGPFDASVCLCPTSSWCVYAT